MAHFSLHRIVSRVAAQSGTLLTTADKKLNVERCLQLHDGSPSATPMIWVSVKELKINYYSKETLLFAMVT